jgi:hypothetical protein
MLNNFSLPTTCLSHSLKKIKKPLRNMLFFVLFASLLQPAQIFAQEDPSIISGKYIVLLKEEQSASMVAQSLGFARTQTYEHVFSGMTISATEDEISRLREDPRVIAIEPDRIMWAFVQTMPTGIDRTDAELNPISKIDGSDDRVDVDIAILDTGIFKGHPDLNLFRFVNFAASSTDDDKQGHGTHVAGITAALDNKIGVVGMAPGAKLWAVKVLGDAGQGSLSDIIKGIDYVTQHADEIEVANMSLGGEFSSSILNTAISNSIKAGVTYVVAAGNDNRDAASFSPANHPEVITVSAISDSDGKPGGAGPQTRHGNDDSLASFSNFGEVVDIAAPGIDIMSSYKDDGYVTLSGTSMSSPHVAGVVALYIAQNGRDVNSDGVINEKDVVHIRESLIKNATPQSDSDGFTGDRDKFAEPLASAAPPTSEGDFALSVEPSSIMMSVNDSKNANVTVSPLNGFVGTVNLKAITPDQISASVFPDSITVEPTDRQRTATLTIRSQNSTGNFSVDVTGKSSDGRLEHSDNVSVTVGSGGGCLIATAAYGTELSPQVQLLREIRDNIVSDTNSGRSFMIGFNQFYYSFSPAIADLERQNAAFREIVKMVITPMLTSLSILNYIEIDSEHEMLGYGIGIILLNIGMYFAAPALVILKLKKFISGAKRSQNQSTKIKNTSILKHSQTK